MGELWRKASETLWARPLLWVPVLVADLLGSGLNLGQQELVRAIVLSHTAVRSVMGGAVQHVPLTAEAIARSAVYAIPLAWFTYFLRILLYVLALLITSELVMDMMSRMGREVEIKQVLGERVGGMLTVALRALAVYAFVALVFSQISRKLAETGHQAILMSPWFRTGISVALVLLLVVVTSTSALRLVSGGPVSEAGEKSAQFLALMMGLVSLGLSSFVGINSKGVSVTPGQRLGLEIGASLLTAIPYVLMFVGFGVLGKDEVDRREREAYAARATD